MFPLYGEICLTRKAVHKWLEEFSQGRLKFADDARPRAEVAGTTDFCAAGFDALLKRWDRCINVHGG
jgi:hypothetical protein